MTDALTPRARAILAAVEREVSARLDEIEHEAGAVAPRRITSSRTPMRAGPELLAALEMGVAGMSRGEVAEKLGVDHAAVLLDAVFGAGSPPVTRLARAA